MKLLLSVALAQLLWAKEPALCYSSEVFFSAENSALGGQTLDGILRQTPLAATNEFGVFDLTYGNTPARFKYINVQSAEDLEKAKNEVKILRKVSRLNRVVRILDCVEGQNFVGIFTAAQGDNLATSLFSAQQPPFLARLELLYKAAEAVAELHSANIAHGTIRLEHFHLKSPTSRQVVLSGLGSAVDLSAPQAVGAEGAALAKDVWDFAVMALIVANYEFANTYYASLAQQGAALHAQSGPRAGLPKEIRSAVRGCEASLQKPLLSWLSVQAGEPISFARIVDEIENVARETILEQNVQRFGVQPVTREKFLGFFGMDDRAANATETLAQAKDAVKQSAFTKFVSKTKAKLNAKLYPNEEEEEGAGVKCWVTSKLNAFNGAMNNFKKRIFRAWSFWGKTRDEASERKTVSAKKVLTARIGDVSPAAPESPEEAPLAYGPVRVEHVAQPGQYAAPNAHPSVTVEYVPQPAQYVSPNAPSVHVPIAEGGAVPRVVIAAQRLLKASDDRSLSAAKKLALQRQTPTKVSSGSFAKGSERSGSLSSETASNSVLSSRQLKKNEGLTNSALKKFRETLSNLLKAL